MWTRILVLRTVFGGKERLVSVAEKQNKTKKNAQKHTIRTSTVIVVVVALTYTHH